MQWTESSDEARRAVMFTIDGVEYELDPADENSRELLVLLDVYVAAARRVSGPGRSSPSRSSGHPSFTRAAAVRPLPSS
jgi:hypothetical protein